MMENKTKKNDPGLPNKAGQPSPQTADRYLEMQIQKFERFAWFCGAILVTLAFGTGFFIWGKIWPGIFIGFLLGLASFHLLMVSFRNIKGSSKNGIGRVVLFSLSKFGFLIGAVAGLNRIRMNLEEVLAGVLLFQLGVPGAALLSWESEHPQKEKNSASA